MYGDNDQFEVMMDMSVTSEPHKQTRAGGGAGV